MGGIETRCLLDSTGYPLGQDDRNDSGDIERSYFVEDPRGNVSQLVAHDDKSVKAVYGYDAFGKERSEHTSKVKGWDSSASPHKLHACDSVVVPLPRPQ